MGLSTQGFSPALPGHLSRRITDSSSHMGRCRMSGSEKVPLPFCRGGRFCMAGSGCSPRELLLEARGAAFRGMGLMLVILEVSSLSSMPWSSCCATVLNRVCTPLSCFLFASIFFAKCLITRSAFVASSQVLRIRMQMKCSTCLLMRLCALQALTCWRSLSQLSLEPTSSRAFSMWRVFRSSSSCCVQALIAMWSRPSWLQAPRRSKTLVAPLLCVARCSSSCRSTLLTSPASALSCFASSRAWVQATKLACSGPITESAHMRATTLVMFALRECSASSMRFLTSFS
mmetsp:Transcript_108682/g.325073  ORF Transcript_108682/g.325073 Transcript_108682/m.325073 type:complete len:287 (+) Transcript_108682:36-896(+)